MSDQTVTVIAVFRIRSGAEERFVRAARAVVPETRAESGCIAYSLHRHADDPTLFMFYEIWRSKADLDFHLATPHIAAFLGEADAVREGDIEVTIWDEIS